jgi:CO/xanthine dehydrogenase Mo-binding subunit
MKTFLRLQRERGAGAGAPQVHRAQRDNILELLIRHGDIEAGFDQADVIVEHVYQTPFQEHAYLQPEAGLGQVLADGRIEIIVAGQWMHEDRKQIAHALGLPIDQVVVRYVSVGGAFGGREDMSVQIVLALATRKLRRPVKIQWSRGESIRGHQAPRHGRLL